MVTYGRNGEGNGANHPWGVGALLSHVSVSAAGRGIGSSLTRVLCQPAHELA